MERNGERIVSSIGRSGLAVCLGVGLLLCVAPVAQGAYLGNTVEADTVSLWDFNGDVDGNTEWGGWPSTWVQEDRAHPGQATQGSASHWYLGSSNGDGSGVKPMVVTNGGIDGHGIQQPEVYNPPSNGYVYNYYGTRYDDRGGWRKPNWTAEAWLKWGDAAHVAATQHIAKQDHIWMLDMDSGNRFTGYVKYDVAGGATRQYTYQTSDTFTTPTAGVWYHVAMTGEAGDFGTEPGQDLRITYYLTPETDDTPVQVGQRVIEVANEDISFSTHSATGGWSIGYYSAADGKPLMAVMDDLKFSSTARTEFESLGPGEDGAKPIPEPATLTLMAAGLGGLAWRRRRR